MSIRIYNSLTRKKEPLEPISGKAVNMYTCGVTVYDRCHIGHARSLYVFDMIRRYLKHRGYDVRFVRNITDVDDKILNRAQETGKTFDEVVNENIEAYGKDCERLGIEKADAEPRATENIPGMIKHIEGLIKKGVAYEAGGDVYFSVRDFEGYGKLSHQDIEQMMDAVRIEPDPRKKDPLDFALWKKAKEGEKSWPSPWGEGRPGWHIECSCMSMKYLKTETLDIHAGGRDLIFPHHENEIAQSEALTGKPFAKYWIHHGLVTIESQKMAKSLNNFITVEDALNKHSADELKLLFLASHYRSPLDYSEERMDEVKKQLAQFREFMDKVRTWRLFDGGVRNEPAAKDRRKIEETRENFFGAMDDDFNTPAALACVFGLVDIGSRFISADKEEAFRAVFNELRKWFAILGLSVPEKPLVTDEALKLIEERRQLKEKKDFEGADKIRDRIRSSGLMVVDTQGGVAFVADNT